jgi:glutamate-1-semialdehyde 2,1-aminomutase
MALAKARVSKRAERSRTPPPRAAAPPYAAVLRDAALKQGAVVRDAAGRLLADFINDDGAILLGWADPRVEARVGADQDPARLEMEAAERLCALVPCAEAVGFRATLEAALADALIAAKTLTDRDGAFFCDDITTVTGDLDALDHAFDLYGDVIAALVIRPLHAPKAFLERARILTDRSEALLIFDESRTAFRVHAGGVQGLTGVRPDIALIGAVIANGRPLAAAAGAMEVMRALPSAGAKVAPAALAAACVTLDRVARENPARVLREVGAEIETEIAVRLAVAGADPWLAVAGDPTWSLVGPRPAPDLDAKALQAELALGLHDHGVLSYGVHTPSLATGEPELGRLFEAYDAILPDLVARAESGAFDLAPDEARP